MTCYETGNLGVIKFITCYMIGNMSPTPSSLEALADVAGDLSSSLATRDRYDRLLQAVRRVVPCDAACLMVLEGNELVPLAGHGLTQHAMRIRYSRDQHPRLDAILANPQPIQFPANSDLPDPFDGNLQADPQALHGIHACLGCALRDGDIVVGALTADALEPRAFDQLDPQLLRLLAGLAGAALRTARLIEALETTVDRQAQDLRDRARDVFQSGFLGVSDGAQRVIEHVRLVAATDLPVLVSGETGVGKELVAAMVHAASPRRERPLVIVNCAALPESLAESELFGHVAGSFTGATHDRAGKFELADRATIFLDEIGELPMPLQAKLLRALQQGEVQRVGSDRSHRVDVRVIAATNRDLDAETAAGHFRADLYHRLAAYPIAVPPLRSRLEDLPILADHILGQLRRRIGCRTPVLRAESLDRLRQYSWPGNVRELDNVLARSVLRAQRDTPVGQQLEIQPRHLSPDLGASLGSTAKARNYSTPPMDDRPLVDQVAEFQMQVISRTVKSHDGNWAAAARSLGMHRANLHTLAKRLGLK
jgi:anaerobic nitric oxide reductase transcription regulator